MRTLQIFLIGSFVTSVSLAQPTHKELENHTAALEDAMWVDYKQGLQQVMALQNTIAVSDCQSCKTQMARLMGKFYWVNGEYDRGLLHFRKALFLADQIADYKTKASTLDLMGNTFYYQAYYDSALHYFKQALRVYEQEQDLQGQITVLHNISLMYHRKGDFNKAIEFLFKEEELKDALPGSVYEIEAMGAMGSLMVDSIYYQEEIRDELDALQNYQKQKDTRGMIRTYRNIGKAYRQLEEFEMAARYFAKACRLQESLGLVPEWDLVGTDFRDANNRDSSFYYHYKAKRETSRMAKPSMAYTIELLGDAHRYFGNYDSALLYYDSAMRMNIQMNNRITFTGIHRYLVNVHTGLKNYLKAEQHLQIGLALAKEVALIHEKNLYREGKLLYESKGDFKKALWFSEKYRTYQDSINRAETALNLTRMQAEFKTTKKVRELEDLQQVHQLNEARLQTRNLQVALIFSVMLVFASIGTLYYYRYKKKAKTNTQLELQKKRIEEQNSELEKQNKTKEVLLSEIHHRVKNNLQIISSLITLKSRQSGVETQAVLNQLSGRIFSMGLLHEKLYKNEDIKSIRLDLYLSELMQYLLDSFQVPDASIRLTLACEETEIGVDQALTCGLICNELFTNSMKYAFASDQENKCIEMKLRKKTTYIELVASDTGTKATHLPENLKGSFGLRFVDHLVTSKLGGTWSYALDGGFKAMIQIPILMNGKN